MNAVTIGHLTDLHVQDWHDLRARDFLTKRLTGYVNYKLLRGSHHKREVLDHAVAHLCEARPDLVVVTGDLTNLGFKGELEAAQRALAPLTAAGIPIRVLPGNHDYYVPESASGLFESTLASWMDGEGYPQVADVGPVRCILLNSAKPTPPLTAYGYLPQAQLDAVRPLAAEARAEGRAILLALHHHPTRAPHKRFDMTRELKNAGALRALATEVGATLVIHGHNHFAELRRLGEGPWIQGLSSSSTDRHDRPERRGQVGLYHFDADGLRDLQVADWTGAGFSDWRSILDAR